MKLLCDVIVCFSFLNNRVIFSAGFILTIKYKNVLFLRIFLFGERYNTKWVLLHAKNWL